MREKGRSESEGRREREGTRGRGKERESEREGKKVQAAQRSQINLVMLYMYSACSYMYLLHEPTDRPKLRGKFVFILATRLGPSSNSARKYACVGPTTWQIK